MSGGGRALSIHADYRCRSSGDCCRSGWEIPVEAAAEESIHAGIGAGRLHPPVAWSRPVAGLPHGARVVLRVLPTGECVFLERGAPRPLLAAALMSFTGHLGGTMVHKPAGAPVESAR